MSAGLQRRPVRALCDAYMHHGQAREGNEKHVTYVKKQVHFTKSGNKFQKVGNTKFFQE